MARIALLIPILGTGDAVSNDVIGMYHTLAAHGDEVVVFAGSWNVAEPEVRHVGSLPHFLEDGASILIYHHAIGWDAGVDILARAKCTRIVKYHNVTPPEFFAGISAELENACRAGREQVKTLARAGYDLYLSDSAFNMGELIACGANPSQGFVTPPFHHIDRLRSLEAHAAVLDAYRDGKCNILTVGRLAPNKGHAQLLEAFAIYHYGYNPNSRLLIVGKEDERLRGYADDLRGRVARLGLQHAVVLTGEVTERVLKAYYLLAHVFVMTSQHEGFCVPLVEAMALKLPIVAYGSSAIPATVGKAGLIWEEGHPELIAGSVNCILENESVSVALGFMGWSRYTQHFAHERVAAQFLRALRGLL